MSKPVPQGDSSRYGINFWREAEGLPQSRIRSIIQTHDGYIWLGTDNGAVRFNGTSFTAFTVETGSLRDNEVWSLVEDNDGGLWMGTYGGGLTLFRDGNFTTFTKADGLPDDVIMQVDKDAEGNIWMATPNGIARYSNGTFSTFTPNNGLSGNYVHALCTRTANGVFAATGQKLFHFEEGHFVLVQGVVSESNGIIEHMLNGHDGSLILSFGNAVIKRWKDDSLTTYDRNNGLTPHITAIYEDPQGTIWAAQENGLNRLAGKRFVSVPIEADVTGFGVIYTLFGDNEGNIWLGLQANGLGRLRINKLSTISVADGLHNDSTRSVFEDHVGTLWIGTAAGFSTYQDGKIVNYVDLGGAQLASIRSFAEDDNGDMWIGSGADLLRMRNGKLTKFAEWKGKFEIEVLYKDSLGRMWIGTDGGGLFLFKGGKFINYRTEDGLAESNVRGILLDSRGNLWVSCFGRGISKFSNGTFKTYTILDGLAGNRVTSLFEDDEGTLWFSTREGLSRFRDESFFNYSAEAGLFMGFTYSILDDGKGSFWFSSAQGLFRVSRAELKAVAEGSMKKVVSVDYGVRDGMKTRAFNLGNQPTAWKTSDGLLMFCSLKGVVVIDPNRIASSGFIPPVYIEDVLINREKRPANGDADMPIGTGEVEIHFAGLSFEAPEKLRFRYMLEGYDQEWVDAGTRRFAYYANLRPGQYKFHVLAGNLDGAWNEEGAVFNFYLQPHFYQTRIFLGLMILAVILIAILIYWYSIYQIRARYSAVLGERKRIAIEIHDTLAQNLAGIALQLDSVTMRLVEMPEGLRENLDQVCNLTRYSLSEARRAVSDLRSDETGHQELALVLPEIAKKMIANSGFQSRMQVSGNPHKLNSITEKNLVRIFQEALANAIKHSEAKIIDIELSYGLDGLLLRVSDNGKGFDSGNIIPLEVGHYGLIGMRERTDRIGGHFKLTSKPGKGTDVTVELPFSTVTDSESVIKLEL